MSNKAPTTALTSGSASRWARISSGESLVPAIVRGTLSPPREAASLCLLTILLATAIACGKNQPDGETLAQRYVERLKENKDRVTEEEELVHYFDASWTAVAWEVMAEQQRQAYLRGARDGWVPSMTGIMDLVEAADREARSIFYRRFCVSPPEKYFPPLVEDVSSVFAAGAEYQRLRWPVLLRGQGLTKVSQIEPFVEQCRERLEKAASMDRRADELAEDRGLHSYDTFTALKVEEILALLSPGSPVNMRLLPHAEELDVLVQAGLAEAKAAGAEVEWGLTPAGTEALRRQPSLEVALGAVEKAPISAYYVTGPLRRGRYFGIGRVVETGYTEPFGPIAGGTGRWIAIEMLEGVSYWNRPYYAGETIPAVRPMESSVEVDPTLAVGDLVGYREIGRPPHPMSGPSQCGRRSARSKHRLESRSSPIFYFSRCPLGDRDRVARQTAAV